FITFGSAPRILGHVFWEGWIAVGLFDPKWESVVDQINYGLDAALQKVIERFVSEAPVPGIWRWIDPVPWNAIAGAPNAEFPDVSDIFAPAGVMLYQFIFVQRPACVRPGRGDEGIFNSHGPEKVVLNHQSTGVFERHRCLRFFSF